MCRHEETGQGPILLPAPWRAPWGRLRVASRGPPLQSLRIFSRGGLGEAEALWPPKRPGASRPVKSVHPPSSPPDPLRLCPPRLLLPLSLACQKASFSKAQLNAVSSKKPSRRPGQLGSVLVPSVAFRGAWRISPPPPFLGRYGKTSQLPETLHLPSSCFQGQAAGPHLCSEQGRATEPRSGPAWRGLELAGAGLGAGGSAVAGLSPSPLPGAGLRLLKCGRGRALRVHAPQAHPSTPGWTPGLTTLGLGFSLAPSAGTSAALTESSHQLSGSQVLLASGPTHLSVPECQVPVVWGLMTPAHRLF